MSKDWDLFPMSSNPNNVDQLSNVVKWTILLHKWCIKMIHVWMDDVNKTTWSLCFIALTVILNFLCCAFFNGIFQSVKWQIRYWIINQKCAGLTIKSPTIATLPLLGPSEKLIVIESLSGSCIPLRGLIAELSFDWQKNIDSGSANITATSQSINKIRVQIVKAFAQSLINS